MFKVTLNVDGTDVAVIDASRGTRIKDHPEFPHNDLKAQYEYHCHAAILDEETGGLKTEHFRVSHWYHDGGVHLANKMVNKLDNLLDISGKS